MAEGYPDPDAGVRHTNGLGSVRVKLSATVVNGRRRSAGGRARRFVLDVALGGLEHLIDVELQPDLAAAGNERQPSGAFSSAAKSPRR
jgi:hypothetical protein